MTDLRTAAQQALEALEATHYAMIDAGLLDQDRLNKNFTAHEALKAALAEPQGPGFWGRVAARQASRIKRLETAAQQALEALEQYIAKELTVGQRYTNEGQRLLDTATSFRAKLAEPVQEPCNKSCAPGYCYCECHHGVARGQP